MLLAVIEIEPVGGADQRVRRQADAVMVAFDPARTQRVPDRVAVVTSDRVRGDAGIVRGVVLVDLPCRRAAVLPALRRRQEPLPIIAVLVLSRLPPVEPDWCATRMTGLARRRYVSCRNRTGCRR